MPRNPLRTAIVAVPAAAVLALTGCSGGSGSAESSGAVPDTSAPVTVTISTPNTVLPFTPLYVAMSEGYFTDEGIEVNLVDGGGGTQVNASLKGGDSQFGLSASSDMINAIEKGADQIATMAINNTMTMDTIVSNAFWDAHGLSDSAPIEKKLAALEGANMGGVSLGGAHEIYLRYNMVLAGLSPDSVNVVKVGAGAAAVAAMTSDQIDGFESGPPTGQQVEAQGAGHILFDPADAGVGGFDNLPWEVLITSPDYAEQNPEVVKAVVRALQRGMQQAHDDPDAAAKIVGDRFPGTDVSLLAAALKEIAPSFAGAGSMSPEGWDNAIKPVKSVGLVSGADSSEGHFWTNEYITTK